MQLSQQYIMQCSINYPADLRFRLSQELQQEERYKEISIDDIQTIMDVKPYINCEYLGGSFSLFYDGNALIDDASGDIDMFFDYLITTIENFLSNKVAVLDLFHSDISLRLRWVSDDMLAFERYDKTTLVNSWILETQPFLIALTDYMEHFFTLMRDVFQGAVLYKNDLARIARIKNILHHVPVDEWYPFAIRADVLPVTMTREMLVAGTIPKWYDVEYPDHVIPVSYANDQHIMLCSVYVECAGVAAFPGMEVYDIDEYVKRMLPALHAVIVKGATGQCVMSDSQKMIFELVEKNVLRVTCVDGDQQTVATVCAQKFLLRMVDIMRGLFNAVDMGKRRITGVAAYKEEWNLLDEFECALLTLGGNQ